MRVAITVLLLCLLNTSYSSINTKEEFTEIFNKANELYKADSFDSAIVLYESLVQAPFETNEVHYNLANSYFKTGNTPYSILHYEKYLKTNSNDQDALFNLKIVNAQITDKVDGKFDNTSFQYLLGNLFELKTWTILSILTCFTAALLGLIYFISTIPKFKKITFLASIIMLFVTGLMLAGGLLKKSQIEEDAYAIITSSSVSVLSEPKNRSKELFVIHEGLKVKIMDQIEDWIEVKLSNGNEGWVKSEELIII